MIIIDKFYGKENKPKVSMFSWLLGVVVKDYSYIIIRKKDDEHKKRNKELNFSKNYFVRHIV